MPEADSDLQPDPLREKRRELALLCRRPRSHNLGWPRKWHPQTVVNPDDEDLQVFTPVGAWEFVAQLLESGHPMEEVVLKVPPGKKGYVLFACGGTGRPRIYIKLEFGAGCVLGRSFHYENPNEE
jgi:hypothetical protein